MKDEGSELAALGRCLKTGMRGVDLANRSFAWPLVGWALPTIESWWAVPTLRPIVDPNSLLEQTTKARAAESLSDRPRWTLDVSAAAVDGSRRDRDGEPLGDNSRGSERPE